MRNVTLVLITFLIAAVLIFSTSDVKTNIIQPPSARTGAPGELTCGTSDCHNNTPNSGSGSVAIAFSDPGLKYVPGNTYDITVTVEEAAQVRFGFELTSLDVENIQAGSFAEINGGSDISFPLATNGRLYASHHNASALKVWTFNWIAPITNVGIVTFYAAGNAANGNNLNTGDHIYTTSLQIVPDNGIGIEEVATENQLTAYSPSPGQLLVQYQSAATGDISMRLFSINGSLQHELLNATEAAGPHTHLFSIPQMPAGIYLLQLRSANYLQTVKILLD